MNRATDATVWCPPSEDIQKLFTFDHSHSVAKSDEISQNVDFCKKTAFTDDELSKLPSTLAKIVRRTDALLAQNEIARKSAIDAHNELKGIQALVVRHAKKYLKDSDTANAIESNKSEPRGFHKPCRISDAMCEFIEKPTGSHCSRVEINHYINEYIKTHKLADVKNAQIICPDEKLWSILSENARGNAITYFSMQKYIKHHFLTSKRE
jgi:chromatin remodeling complex protein RSC6